MLTIYTRANYLYACCSFLRVLNIYTHVTIYTLDHCGVSFIEFHHMVHNCGTFTLSLHWHVPHVSHMTYVHISVLKHTTSIHWRKLRGEKRAVKSECGEQRVR